MLIICIAEGAQRTPRESDIAGHPQPLLEKNGEDGAAALRAAAITKARLHLLAKRQNGAPAVARVFPQPAPLAVSSHTAATAAARASAVAADRFAPYTLDEELVGTVHGDVEIDPTVPGYAELYAAAYHDTTVGTGNPTRLAAVLQGYALAAPEELVLPAPQD